MLSELPATLSWLAVLRLIEALAEAGCLVGRRVHRAVEGVGLGRVGGRVGVSPGGTASRAASEDRHGPLGGEVSPARGR